MIIKRSSGPIHRLAGARPVRASLAAIGLIALTGITPGGVASAGGGHHHRTGFHVVASGLDNPRGLAFRPNGQLIVGEAGHAGTDACFPGNPENPGGQTCIGFTSQISVISVRNGSHWPIVTGLVSVGDGPVGTTGVDGVTTRGHGVFGIITASPQGAPPPEACGGNADCVDALTAATAQLGKLIRGRHNRHWSTVADVGAFNYDWIVATNPDPANPDFQPGDANPYAVTNGHRGFYAVDGGSNTLDFVKPNGDIKVLAYLPNPAGPVDQRFPYDAVPTCVAKTPRGVVVGDLAGRVWKWSHGKLTRIHVPAGMLNHVNGCTADDDGNVYVVDMFSGFTPTFDFLPNTGSVVKIGPHGAKTIAKGLNLPGGIAIGPGGGIYVSNNAICPADLTGVPAEVCTASGQVVRLQRRAG